MPPRGLGPGVNPRAGDSPDSGVRRRDADRVGVPRRILALKKSTSVVADPRCGRGIALAARLSQMAYMEANPGCVLWVKRKLARFAPVRPVLIPESG